MINNNVVRELFNNTLIHGVVYGRSVRRLPLVQQATQGLLLAWKIGDRFTYTTKEIKPSLPTSIQLLVGSDWETYVCCIVYNYDYVEENKVEIIQTA